MQRKELPDAGAHGVAAPRAQARAVVVMMAHQALAQGRVAQAGVQAEADAEIHVLRGRERLIETADGRVGVGAHDQVRADQAGIAREEVLHVERRGRHLASAFGAVREAIQQVGTEHVQIVGRHQRDRRCQIRGQPLVVIVEEGEQRATRQRGAAVAGAARPAPAVVRDDARPGGRARPRDVAGAVVDDDDLDRRERLGAYRREGARQQRRAIAGRDDDADRRETPPGPVKRVRAHVPRRRGGTAGSSVAGASAESSGGGNAARNCRRAAKPGKFA